MKLIVAMFLAFAATPIMAQTSAGTPGSDVGVKVAVSQTTPVASREEKAVLALSQQMWRWMSERNTDSLATLFHEKAMFVHMSRTLTKEAELDVIRTGSIQYKNVDIQDASVRLVGTTAIVLTKMRLGAIVRDNEVSNPFMVTEVYVRQGKNWSLVSLAFTRLVGD